MVDWLPDWPWWALTIIGIVIAVLAYNLVWIQLFDAIDEMIHTRKRRRELEWMKAMESDAPMPRRRHPLTLAAETAAIVSAIIAIAALLLR